MGRQYQVNGIDLQKVPFSVDLDDFDLEDFCNQLDDAADSRILMETVVWHEAPSGQYISLSEFSMGDADGPYPWSWSNNERVDMWSCEDYICPL